MNESQLQAWLVDRAPVTVPVSLRERVARILIEVAPGRQATVGLGWLRPVAHASRRRRVLALGLVAALLTTSAIAVGSLGLRPELQPLPLPGNGLITVATGAVPLIIDPATGDSVPVMTPSISGRAFTASQLTGATNFAWSPDGRSLAYATSTQIMLADIAIEGVQPIAELDGCGPYDACDVAWSPDGASIAFSSGRHLRVVDRDGLSVSTIASVTDSAMNTLLSAVSWSPDGRTIAMVSGKDIWTVRPDGSGLTRILTEDAERSGPLDIQWSPDGKRIGFMSSDENWEDLWGLEVVVVDADGSDRRMIIDAGECYCMTYLPKGFAWSPDGTQIAFISPGYAQERRGRDPVTILDAGLYVAHIGGGNRRMIAPEMRGSLAWQPVP